jgi:hypothetical protein
LQETLRLNDALVELARVDAPLAALRGMGERSVQREWAKAARQVQS